MGKLAELRVVHVLGRTESDKPRFHHTTQDSVQFWNFPFIIFRPQLATERKLLQVKARIMGDCTQLTYNFQSYSEILT